MRFPAVVLWWEEWQLRILAISSLLLQWFLFFSAASRKFQIGGFLRFLIWMSYLAADALAIYALATLFNRHRQPASASSSNSHGLEVLWAPVLLIHLGGQDTITAYNIEDNELWTRHVTTMVSQVTTSCSQGPLRWRRLPFSDRVWKQVYEAIQTSLVARWIPSIIMRPLKENVYHRFKKWLGRPRWSKTIAQYNLLDSFTRDTRPAVLSISARWFGCKDYLDQIQYVEHQSSSSGGITEVALAHVRRGWMEYIHDVATYKRFNSQKGRWTLEREQCYRQLRWSIRKPFDESVLLWHIATDLCFRQLGCQPGPDQGPRITRCREMSNYMIYLLFFQPEMLLAGTRRNLFTAACGDLEKLFGSDKPSLEDGVLSREIFDKAARAPPGTSIHNASRLGKTLLRFGDDDKMWKVMEGVWVEMLCYSASRCRGYLHAKSLGSGGEYLSYVWLLLSYMGMESLADRFQQPEDTEEEDDGEEGIVAAGPVTYQCQGTVDESEIYPV